MLKERAKEVAASVALCDMILLCVSFFAAFLIRFRILPQWSPDLLEAELSHFLWLLFLSIFTFHILLRAGGVYGSLRRVNLLDIPLLVAKPIALGSLFLGAVIFL